HDIDAALGALDRAIGQLGFRGVQIYTDIQGRPLDDPNVAPIFERVIESCELEAP
ncbi:MAG: amidohydrolase, partial [Chloroflexi bacterium]